MYGITFTDGRTGWAVGGSGAILHTTTGGASWTLQQSETTQNLARVTFTDERTGWAVGALGTILHTTDGGARNGLVVVRQWSTTQHVGNAAVANEYEPSEDFFGEIAA